MNGKKWGNNPTIDTDAEQQDATLKAQGIKPRYARVDQAMQSLDDISSIVKKSGASALVYSKKASWFKGGWNTFVYHEGQHHKVAWCANAQFRGEIAEAIARAVTRTPL